jgi:DnaJ-class molecular chaperone
MNYTANIDGVLFLESDCPHCNGKGAVEVMVPGTQGYDRYPMQDWEWHKCHVCDGKGVIYEEVEVDGVH